MQEHVGEDEELTALRSFREYTSDCGKEDGFYR